MQSRTCIAAQFGRGDFWQFLVLAASATLLVLAHSAEVIPATARAATPRDLSSSNLTQRIEAAEYLKRNWRTEMGPMLKEISSFRGEIDVIADTKDEDRRLYFRALTDALRAMINHGSREAIELFREKDNHDVIFTLVRAARGIDRGIRINSTMILANVSDNSSVCVAVDELRDPALHDKGRINLVQVVRTVASYMYKENWDATKISLDKVKSHLERNKSQDYVRTLNFIKDIEARLDRNQRKETPLPPRHSTCADYQYRF